MKIKKNFWRAGKALWIQIIAFAVAVMLYSVCCYPIYTSSKARIMRQLYEDIHDMDLEELSEDDEETLGDYQKEKFVRVLEKDVCPQTKWVEGSNYVDVNFKIDERTNRIIMMGAMDNLVKGAAGQAVQNMNLMFGLPETTGLELVPMFP